MEQRYAEESRPGSPSRRERIGVALQRRRIARRPRSAQARIQRQLKIKYQGNRVSYTHAKAVSLFSFAATSQYNLLNGMQLGTTTGTRVGRRILMKRLLMRMYTICGSAAGVDTFAARVTIVYDRAPNAAAPTDAMLFETAQQLTSPVNLDNAWRFQVIMDDTFTWCAIGGSDMYTINKDIPLELETIYNSGNAGTVADITHGSLYLVTSQSGTTTGPKDETTIVIEYVDP